MADRGDEAPVDVLRYVSSRTRLKRGRFEYKVVEEIGDVQGHFVHVFVVIRFTLDFWSFVQKFAVAHQGSTFAEINRCDDISVGGQLLGVKSIAKAWHPRARRHDHEGKFAGCDWSIRRSGQEHALPQAKNAIRLAEKSYRV